MDDETNRLRDEFLGAFQKPQQQLDTVEPSIGLIIAEIRQDMKRINALLDEMEKVVAESKQKGRAVADNMIDLLKRIE